MSLPGTVALVPGVAFLNVLKVLAGDALLLAAQELSSWLQGTEGVASPVAASAVGRAPIPFGPLHVTGGGVAWGLLSGLTNAGFGS